MFPLGLLEQPACLNRSISIMFHRSNFPALQLPSDNRDTLSLFLSFHHCFINLSHSIGLTRLFSVLLQLDPSPSDTVSQLDVSLPAECGDDSVCAPASSLGLPEFTQDVASASPPPPPPPEPPERGTSPPPPGDDVDEQLVMELSQRADSSVRRE